MAHAWPPGTRSRAVNHAPALTLAALPPRPAEEGAQVAALCGRRRPAREAPAPALPPRRRAGSPPRRAPARPRAPRVGGRGQSGREGLSCPPGGMPASGLPPGLQPPGCPQALPRSACRKVSRSRSRHQGRGGRALGGRGEKPGTSPQPPPEPGKTPPSGEGSEECGLSGGRGQRGSGLPCWSLREGKGREGGRGHKVAPSPRNGRSRGSAGFWAARSWRALGRGFRLEPGWFWTQNRRCGNAARGALRKPRFRLPGL